MKYYELRRLRYKRTRASNVVRANIQFLLTGELKWDITGAPSTDPHALPSWWPFWSDVLKKNVIEAVRAARALAKAEETNG